MMAAWLRRCLAVEAVALVVVALGLAHGGVGHMMAVAAAIGIVLAVVSAPLAVCFAISRRHSCAPMPGAVTALRLGFREWLAYMAVFVLIQPFERCWMGAEAVSRTPAGAPVPVLLIHGYLCNRGTWWWLRRRLRAAGIAAATINLEPPLASIEAFAAQLHERIEALVAETGADRVALVGHSMGGLVARAYLARHGPRRVAQLVTLATPHLGSLTARIGPGANAREMRVGSTFIATLPPADPSVPTVSIWSPADNFVAPQESSRLAGAAEIVLPHVTHLAMLFSVPVLAALRRELILSSPPTDSSWPHGRIGNGHGRQK
jgi:triacylglycerol lipase